MSLSTPKNGAGIDPNLVKTYDYTRDTDWADTSSPASANLAKFEHLTQFAVQVGDVFYVRDKTTGVWTDHGGRATAERVLTQQRSGTLQVNGQWVVITADDIKSFFKNGVLKFAGTIYAPGCSDFVLFDDQKRLNVYADKRLTGDTDHLPASEEFLKVIRNSLCAQPDEIGLDAMLSEIRSDRPTEFRWVMHWLAARYQKPGYAPQTNLWFIGRRGTGKGTLIQAMSAILGSSTVGKVVQEDIAKGWTDSFLHKQLLEWDEFKAQGGWRDFGNLIKEKTGNTRVSINKRNVGSSAHPAIAMHVFGSNEKKPMMVEEDDRQNTMIETVAKNAAGDAWVRRAKALFDLTTRQFKTPNLASGFAAVLNEIEIDVPFICAPLETPKRLELKGISLDTVVKWVEDGGADEHRTEDKPNGVWVEWQSLYGDYREYVRDFTHSKPEDLAGFKSKMKEHGFGKDSVRKVPTIRGPKSTRGCALSLPPIVDADAEIDTEVHIHREARQNIVAFADHTTTARPHARVVGFAS